MEQEALSEFSAAFCFLEAVNLNLLSPFTPKSFAFTSKSFAFVPESFAFIPESFAFVP